MKVKILVLAIALLIAGGSFGAVGTNSSMENENTVLVDGEYIPGEVVIGFYTQVADFDPVDVRTIDSFEGRNIIQKIEELNVAVVEVNEGEELDFIDSISNSPLVEFAEPNFVVHATHIPNDPRWESQWGPQRINCEAAWDINEGSKSVKVAIVDTGIDYNHEDLAGNYVSGGYDYVNGDSNPMDDNDHGSHCAGIAAGVMDNDVGIAGVAQVEVMAEKVLGSGGSGSSSDVAAGITHAVGQGADIISLSLGGSESSTIKNACDNAYAAGVLLVAASGNDYNDEVGFPAAHASCIAVGSIDNDDTRSDFSNYGDELELVAPGRQILSTTRGDDYEYFTGTSMATPHVAGVAALAISRYPSYSNEDIRDLLTSTAEDLGPDGWDEEYGYGLVDATLGGGGGLGATVTVKINRVKEMDDIDFTVWPFPHNNPEWYYRVSIDQHKIFEYNGQDTQFLFWWIFTWNSDNDWSPNKQYSFLAENPDVTFKIKLMDHDDWDELFMDDLADVSGYSGGGADNNIDDKRGAIFTGKYNLFDHEFVDSQTDYYDKNGDVYTIHGENPPDSSTGSDQNDAKVWFEISDDYSPPVANLDVDGSLSGTTQKGTTNYKLGTFTVKNVGTDPLGWSDSYLDWEIDEYPNWGSNWRCDPSSQNGLKSGSSKSVSVYVDVPNEEKTFTGNLKVINKNKPSDSGTVPITLTAPRTRSFLNFLENYPILFQILQRFLNL